MRKITLISLLSLLAIPLWSQENLKKIDSLNSALNKTTDNKVKASIYNELADNYQPLDMKKCVGYIKLAQRFSKKANDTKQLAHTYSLLASNSLVEAKPNKSQALKYISVALKMTKSASDTLGHAEALLIKSRCFMPEQPDKAKLSLQEALSYSKKLPPQKKVLGLRALVYNNLAQVYLMESKYEIALGNLNNAVINARKKKNYSMVAQCYSLMSDINFQLDNGKDAVKYAELAIEAYSKEAVQYPNNTAILYGGLGIAQIEEKQYSKGIASLQKAIPIFEEFKLNYPCAVHLAYLSRGYCELKEFDKAIAIGLKGLKFNPSDPSIDYELYHYLGKSNYGKGNYKEAKKFFSKAIEAGIKLPEETQIAETYNEAAKNEAALGNHKAAYELYLKGSTLEKEKLLAQKEKKMDELNAKFELTDKNIQLKDLTINQQKSDLKIANQQTRLFAVGGVLAIVALMSGMLWNANRNNKRNNKVLKGKNEIIENSLAEKDLLLKEIHHRVKNNLQLVISLLSFQSSKFKNKELNDFLESGTGRIVSMALIHENLYQQDNVASINFQEYAESLIKNIIASMADKENVEFSLNAEDITFDIKRAIPVGLILNELIVNTIKHNYKSGSKLNFSVDLKKVDKQYELTYNDPQSNMTSEDTKKSSFGLELIHLLAAQLKGKSSLSFTNGLTAEIAF